MRQDPIDRQVRDEPHSGPLFWVAVDNKRSDISNARPKPALLPVPSFGSGEEPDIESAVAWWTNEQQADGLPDPELLNSIPASQFLEHSLLLDFVAGNKPQEYVTKVRQIGEGLSTLLAGGEKLQSNSRIYAKSLVAELQDQFSSLFKTRKPVRFEIDWFDENRPNTAFDGVLLPFGSKDITAVMSLIELSTPDRQEKGEEVLNLDETLILKDDEKSDDESKPDFAASHANDGGPERVKGHTDQASLSALISGARESAEHARKAEERVRKLQFAALGQSYDLALWAANNPEELAVQLIFGADCGEEQLEHFASVLRQARSCNVEKGEMVEYLEDLDRGSMPLAG